MDAEFVRARTRAEVNGAVIKAEPDPDTGKPYPAVRGKSGHLVDKNRSDGWRGYKSHLTPRQRRLIAWALRQRDRGFDRERVWIELQKRGWQPSPMQYPLTMNTIASWELTRRAMAARGKEWPLTDTTILRRELSVDDCGKA